MNALYNELEPFAVQWLRNLSSAGHIAKGTVDGRSIRELSASDLVGVTQAHFFAGIGVWSHALRLAGWPDDAPVWTGSCPCQPFSVAGKGAGFDDDRHLWPVWFELIRQCRPPVVFGEQVEGADGRAWLDLVSADLEGIGYAFGAAILPAAGVGAPHLRHRTFFVADAADLGLNGRRAGEAGDGRNTARVEPERLRIARGLGDSGSAGSGRDAGAVPGAETQGEGEGGESRRVADLAVVSGAVGGFWGDAEWIHCRDEKWRPVEPGTFPLAHGASTRVGRLRAYGNAIVAEVAATFIRAAMESGVRP